MEIINFSRERGIIAIFNGYGEQAYLIHSSFYGFVGYADILENPGSDKITVNVYLCNGSRLWYWSLANIVKRGIRKSESRFISKEITFNVKYLDKFNGETPCYSDTICQPEREFRIQLYDGVREV